MTTCLAYGINGTVYMAADSMTNVYTRPVNSATKIAKIQRANWPEESFLLSAAGDGGLLSIVAEVLAQEDPDIAECDDLDHWARKLARQITRIAVNNGIVEDGRMDGQLLLAFRGRVWTVIHNQAIAHPDNIAAIGSGEGPAIGALDMYLLAVSLGEAPADPKDVLLDCLMIAADRDQHTMGPLIVEEA